MNIGVKWAAVATAGMAVVFLLTPQEKVDRGHESWLRLRNDAGQACLDYERQHLKDPDSAQLTTVSKGQDSSVTIAYKAKNSYGAFGQSEAVCVIEASGKVSDFRTGMRRESIRMEAKTKLLVEDNKCLQRQYELIKKGNAD